MTKKAINDGVAVDVISKFDGDENYLVDVRNGITRDEMESFFGAPTCDPKKIKTNNRCPVYQRGNQYGSEVDNSSLTRKFEEFANVASGRTIDGKNLTIEPSSQELKSSRESRSKNAEARSTSSKSKKSR